MPTSYNGWSASPTLRIRPLVVAGESFAPGVRDDDDVYVVLQYVAQQMHERVERIVADGWHQADDWGFSYRANANDPNSLSNHSSGTAIDYNATRHPNGVPTRNTFTAAQVAEIHRILAEVEYVVAFGGDYRGTPDAMHFELDENPAAVARVAARIRKQSEEDDMAQYAEQLNDIENAADEAARISAQTLKELRAFRSGKSESDQKVRAFLRQILAEGRDDATSAQAREILAELEKDDGGE